MCTPRAENPGIVLLTCRNPPKYFYQWFCSGKYSTNKAIVKLWTLICLMYVLINVFSTILIKTGFNKFTYLFVVSFSYVSEYKVEWLNKFTWILFTYLWLPSVVNFCDWQNDQIHCKYIQCNFYIFHCKCTDYI